MAATQTPIDRLAALSAQRTARTDRLHEATQALLSRLDFVDVGAVVTVDGYKLRRTRLRSNIGYQDGWSFGPNGVDLDRPLDREGYVHGDFNCSWKGPSRSDLIEFASRAARFVEALIAREETIDAALSAAQTTVVSAAQKLA